MKICSKCNIEKEESEFIKYNVCIDCYKKYKKEYRSKNKEKQRQYYIDNKEKLSENHKKYHTTNKEKLNKKSIEWSKNNKNRLKEYHKNPINRKKINIRINLRKISNPLYNLRLNVSSLISKSIKNRSYSKSSHTYQLLGCSYEEFIAYLGPKPDGDVHLDHICPCSQAQNEEELIKLQYYTNFRWLSAQENLIKNDNKTPEAEAKCKELLNREWV